MTSLIESAISLQETLSARGAEIEASRRLPQDLSQTLAKAGFYRMFVPQAYGGLELPPGRGVEVFEALAIGDASAAWVAFIGATTGTCLSALPESGARTLFDHPDTLLTGVFAPRGKAEKVDGGYVMNGHWQWGSGSENASWVAGGCLITENGETLKLDNGAPRQHMLFVPAADVEFLDTWNVSGLCGTGSTDFAVSEVFVPDDRAVDFGAHRMDRPLYQFPQFSFLALGIAGVALGIARVAINELTALAGGKTPTGSTKPLADKPVTQSDVAKAEALVRSARLYLLDTIDGVWDRVNDGGRVTVADRAELRLATTHAVQSCVDAVDRMYNLGGGTSVYRESRLQQCFRDIHVVTQHVMVSPATLETIGRLYLDVPANTATL